MIGRNVVTATDAVVVVAGLIVETARAERVLLAAVGCDASVRLAGLVVIVRVVRALVVLAVFAVTGMIAGLVRSMRGR